MFRFQPIVSIFVPNLKSLMRLLSILSVLLFVFAPLALTAQETTIWQENFEKTTTLPPAWRNVSQPPNVWVLNSEYESRVGPSTPLQSKEITGSPQSRYLHITNERGRTQNAVYDPASEVISEVITPRISTVGYMNVRFDFWMLCFGQKGDKTGDYGSVWVSINNNAFQPLLEHIVGVGNWQKISIPSRPGILDNATVQFKFVWRNDADNAGEPPSFSVDEMTLSGTKMETGLVINESTTRSVCAGTAFRISYIGFSKYDLNNAFTAEISDSRGNFDNPVVIGKFESQLSQGVIFCTIPPEVNEGVYQLRIRSSNPEEISNNTITLVVNTPPIGGTATAVTDMVCMDNSGLVTVSDFKGTITWEYSFDGFTFISVPNSDLAFFSTDPITRPTWFRARLTNGACSPAFSNVVKINVAPAIFEGTPNVNPGQFCKPTPVTLTLTDATDGAMIQWQSSNDLELWTDIEGGTSSVFTTQPIEVTTYFRAAVYSALCPQPKYTFTVEVNFGVQIYCDHSPRFPMPNETVTWTIYANDVPNQSVLLTFDPGDGSPIKEFPNVVKFPFEFQHVYRNSITTTYHVNALNNEGCEGSCGGLISVLEQSINLRGGVAPYLCTGQTGDLIFESRGEFGKENRFIVELSDERGSFDAALDITLEWTDDLISFRIPDEGLSLSNQYQIRIRSTQPVVYSEPITGITIFPPIEAGVVAVSQEFICNSESVTLFIKGHDQSVSLVWEHSEDGINFKPIEKSEEMTVWETERLEQNTYFRASLIRIGFGTCDPAYSETLLVKVGMPVTCSYEPIPAEVGRPTIFRVQIENDPGAYMLDVQFGDGQSATFADISTNPFTFQHIYTSPGEFEYTIKIRGRNCAGSCSRSITVGEAQFAVSLVSVNPKKTAFCGGESITIEGQATAMLSRSGRWILELSDGTGSFANPTVLANDMKSDATHTFNVTLPEGIGSGTGYRFRIRTELPEAVSEISPTAYTIHPKPAKPEIEVMGDQKTLRVKNGSQGTYQWFQKDNATPVGSGVSYNPPASGTFKVVHTNAGGCSNESVYIDFTLVSVTTKKVNEPYVKVYPNPVRNDFDVQMVSTSGTTELQLFNMMGQKVAGKKVTPIDGRIEENFDISDYPSGIYFLKVIAGGKDHIVKIVKQ